MVSKLKTKHKFPALWLYLKVSFESFKKDVKLSCINTDYVIAVKVRKTVLLYNVVTVMSLFWFAGIQAQCVHNDPSLLAWSIAATWGVAGVSTSDSKVLVLSSHEPKANSSTKQVFPSSAILWCSKNAYFGNCQEVRFRA